MEKINFRQVIVTQCNKCYDKLYESSKKERNIKMPEVGMRRIKNSLYFCVKEEKFYIPGRGDGIYKGTVL